MNRKLAPWLATTLTLACTLGTPAAADRLVTHDGRVLEVRKARPLENGNYMLTFDSMSFECPGEFIASVEVEGDMSDYVPQNADERKKLEQGYVRYKGKWMSKAAYEGALAKEAAARRKEVEELAAHAYFRDGWEVETKHFRIKTNTSEELLDYYANLLEAYYKLMDKRVGIKPTPKLSRTKMRVNIYKSRDDWEKNNEAGVGGGVVGYFSFRDETLNFFHDYSDPAFTNWVALHECTHLLTYLIEPQSWPRIWVNEGVADFFGSSQITTDKKGRIEITPGELQLDRTLTVQQAIEDDSYVRLEDLFQVEKSNFSAFEYAHAWSFVYFLNNTKKYQSGFKKFFKQFYTVPKSVDYEWQPFPNVQGTAKIIPADEVRRILLKNLKVKDVEALEKEWIDAIKAIDIDGPDALFKRAYLSIRRGDVKQFEQAEKDLDAAIAAGNEDPRAFWARGMIRSWNAKAGIKAGIPDLRRAVELSPLNANYRFTLGQALSGFQLNVGGSRMTVSGADESDLKAFGDEKELDEAESQLGLACELAPDNLYYPDFLDDFRSRR